MESNDNTGVIIDQTGIDRTSDQPVFRQIYKIILGEIQASRYDGEGKLPSEKELCLRFNVERNTVRKALKILVDEELISRVPGVGTRIRGTGPPEEPPPSAPPGNRSSPKLALRKERKEPSRGNSLGAAPPGNRSSPKFAHRQERKESGEGLSSRRRQNNIILLITQVDYLHSTGGESFHYKLIHRFEDRLSRLGYNLLFKPVAQDGMVAETIRGAAPRGIIFDSFNQDSHYREAVESGVPCVSVNHYTPLFTSIVSDNFQGAYEVTKKLVDAGHRRIAFIMGKNSHQTNTERFNGAQALCGSRGISLKNDYLIPGDWTFGSGAEAAKKILAIKAAQRPTAIFAFNDDLAYGCYSVLRNRGLSIPADMSLAGFDKSDRYAAMFPPITTVDVNLSAMVDYACWYLSSSLSGWAPKGSVKIQIDTTLCDKGTVKALEKGKGP